MLARRSAPRGQSLVEFALVLPILLVLLFGLADFGRVFQAGITLEAVARNAAEAAAQEYVQLVRNKAGGILDAMDYDHLHDVALETACEEAKTLPNWAVDGMGNCTMPLAAMCVHDGSDPMCGAEAGTAPDCPHLTSAWTAMNLGPAPSGSQPLPHVEVRACYQFTTLFNLTDLELPLGWSISLGEIWLERDRQFTVACYQQTTGPCN